MKTLFLIITFAITSACFPQHKTDWQYMELKGKVKSVTKSDTYRYMQNGVFRPWERTYIQTNIFDKSGQRTEFIEMKADSSTGYKVAYKYLPKEKKTEISYFDKSGKPTFQKIWLWNDRGQKTEELEHTREGKLDRRYEFTYDEKGNNITMAGYKADGTMTSKYTWTYNSSGKKQMMSPKRLVMQAPIKNTSTTKKETWQKKPGIMGGKRSPFGLPARMMTRETGSKR